MAVKNSIPLIQIELVEWLESCVDTTPRKSDTDEVLRWKGAQSEILDILRNNFEAQRTGKQKAHTFRRKSDD